MFKPEYDDDGLFATQEIPGEEGFTASGAGLAAVYDSRDNNLFPFSGQYITLSNHFYQDWLGGDTEFFNLKLDARAYFNPGQGSHVIAIQGLMQVNTGNPPFMMLSKLGGDELMRGHFQGRYRDRHILAGQVEYRFPIWWRFIGVAFVGVGEVAPEFSAFTLRGLKYSMGGGLRFTLDAKERINIRFDYGYGLHRNHGFYFGISEAF
jgi:outer membrane translocation and assembly module TamA